MITFDLETYLIQPAQLAPPAVCAGFALDVPKSADEVELLHARFDRASLERWFVRLLDSKDRIVGANVAFDFAVLLREFPHYWREVFDLYDRDRVFDVQIAAKLEDIAEDKYFTSRARGYSLEALAAAYLGETLDKTTWRLRYGTLLDKPLSTWDPGARVYPQRDVWATAKVAESLLKREAERAPSEKRLSDVFRQGRAAWWIHLMMCWGFKTDPAAARALRERVKREHKDLSTTLRRAGILREDGSRNTLVAAAMLRDAFVAQGLPVPVTGKGATSLDEEACLASGDPTLAAYARFSSVNTVLTKDVPALEAPVIQSRFEVLVETGRTSCSGGAKSGAGLATFQLQNVRREPGVREVFVPRPGSLLLSVDYSQMELHAFAQACLVLVNTSTLAERLNEKVDVHLWLGAKLGKFDYETAKPLKKQAPYSEARQIAKIANFGFLGGLGAASFKAYAKASYGVELTDEQARDVRNEWLATWPEAGKYFQFISRAVGQYGTLVQVRSGRIRGGCTYTSGCNTLFQGLAADAAKDAGFRLARACYATPASPLFGARTVNFVHDEFILEVPEGRAHECALEVVRLMEDAGRVWMPDCPPRAEPALMRRWAKDAEPVYRDGRLVPWEPRS